MKMLLYLPVLLVISHTAFAMDKQVKVSGFPNITETVIKIITKFPTINLSEESINNISNSYKKRNLENLLQHNVVVYQSGQDLVIYFNSEINIIKNVRTAITNLLMEKLETEMYCDSTSIDSHSLNREGFIFYRSFFAGKRIVNSNINQNTWFELIDEAIDKAL